MAQISGNFQSALLALFYVKMAGLRGGGSRLLRPRRVFNRSFMRRKFRGFSTLVLVAPPGDVSRWHVCILLFRDLSNGVLRESMRRREGRNTPPFHRLRSILSKSVVVLVAYGRVSVC